MTANPIDPDDETEPVVEDRLLTEVRHLNARITALGTAMFSREDAKKARRRFIGYVLVAILIAQVISLGTFVTVASACFTANPAPRSGTWLRTTCDLIPGYDSSIKQGQKNLKEFQDLLAKIPANSTKNTQQDQEIARLKKAVARLEHK